MAMAQTEQSPTNDGFSSRLSPLAQAWEPEHEYCMAGCLHDNKDLGKMSRCITCMRWYHGDCVGESASYKGAWACAICR